MQTAEIPKFEEMLLEHMRTSHSDVLNTIKKEGEISADTDARLKTIMDAFIGQGHFKLTGS